MNRASIRVSRGARTDALDDALPRILDATMGAIDAAILVTDGGGRIEMWNGGAEQVFGWSAVEAIGSLARDLIVPTDDLDRSAAIRASLAQAGEWQGRFPCRRRDGEVVHVDVTDIAIVEPDGSVRSIVCVAHDLTAELAAECGANALEALADASVDAVMTVVGETITSWNPAAQLLLGWTADETIGASVYTIIPSERSAECGEVIELVHRGEPIADHVTERLARDGSLVPVRVDVAPVYDPARHEWFGVVTMRDQRSRDVVIEAATIAEARYRSLMASSTEVIVVVDDDGLVKAISSSVARLLGFDPDELIGRDVFSLLHPDDLTAAVTALGRVRAEPREQSQVTYRRLSADGTWRWAEATLTNMSDDPVIDGIVINVQDTHEREEARALLESREALYRTLFESSADVAIVADVRGVIREVTRSCTRVLGRTPESLVGRRLSEALGSAVGGLVEQARTGGDHEALGLEVDGIWIDAEVRNLLTDPAVAGFVVHLRDVTARLTAATELQDAHEQLARLALVDDLTGLPNRNALLELARTGLAARAEGRECGVVFFDIDDFCDVNDSLGHAVGDALLVGIAERLAHRLPVGCHLTRFGDDQFAVFCVDIADSHHVMSIARLIQAGLIDPFVVDGHEVFVVVSVGVALSPPADVDTLLRRADTALYRAKKAGRGRTIFFERELATESRQRLHYAGELRRGIERNEIHPHYQPVVDLSTGRVVAVEALARWSHPVDGLIPPDVFIPAAESTGLIGELGRQILEESCRDAIAWFGRGRRLPIAVNASAVQLMDSTFPSQVAEALILTGLPADQLTFEITETAAMREMSTVLGTLGRLRQLGVDLSLDDFGTGYSSLSLLKGLPVDTLKIDRTFVAGLGRSEEDDRIVEAVVGLALVLGFRVVAEGVETEEQAVLLRDLGCNFGQGYLWSPAVPSADLIATVDAIERGA